MISNICIEHKKEFMNFCELHNKFLCLDCKCESLNCFKNFINLKFNNNEYNSIIEKVENIFKNLEEKKFLVSKKLNNINLMLEDYFQENIMNKEFLKDLIKNENNNIVKILLIKSNLNLEKIYKISKKFNKLINELDSFLDKKITNDVFYSLNFFNLEKYNEKSFLNIKQENESSINFQHVNNNIDSNDMLNYMSENIKMESYFSSNDILNNKNKDNVNKKNKKIQIDLIASSLKKIDKLISLIIYKKKYLVYTKINNDKVYFEILKDNKKKFLNKSLSFSTGHKKNINYIKVLNNSNIITCSLDRTMKIYSINFNSKNIAKLLYKINISKSIIKIIETTNNIITLLNVTNNNKESIIEFYNNEKFNKIKNKLFEKSIPNDILYIKSGKFGLEENIEEFVISFAKEEKIIFYDIKNEFNKTIIGNIKCSKKKDSMKIYNDILIIGGQNIFYFIDFYTKHINLIFNDNVNISSLNIINNLLLVGDQKGKILIYKIIKDKKLEKITQKKLQNSNNVHCLVCNEECKILYIYYYPYLEIIQIKTFIFYLLFNDIKLI